MAISPQQLKIYLTSAHRAVIFAIAQLSCFILGQGADILDMVYGHVDILAFFIDFTVKQLKLLLN